MLTRTRCSLQFVEPRRLRVRATRNEQRGEHSPKRRIRLAPAQPGQRDEHLGFLPRVRCRIARDPAPGVAPVEHQSSHSIRMTSRIGDRHRTASAGAEQAELVHAGGIDHSLEVVDPVLQRKARILPVGQTAAALVVPDEGVLLAQELHPVAPDRRRPVTLEVGHPMSGLDHRRAVPARGVGEPHAIRRGAEPQFLAHVNMLRARRHARRRNLGSSTDAVRSVKFLSFGRMKMVRPMISSQNGAVVSNDDPLTRTWIGDDRIQCRRILRPMPHAPRCPSGQPFRMVIFTNPREAALAAQRNSVLRPETDERITGYGVMGLPFRSGHFLARRHMPASSIGAEHQTVWHCGPDGTWTFIPDTGPQQRYARYFASNDSARTTRLDTERSWDGSLSLRVIGPDVLDWRIELAPIPAAVLTCAIDRRLKSSTWRSKTFQRAIGAVAPYVLRTGRILATSGFPNATFPGRQFHIRETSIHQARAAIGVRREISWTTIQSVAGSSIDPATKKGIS